MPITDSNDISERPFFAGDVAEIDLTNITSGTAEGEVLMGVFVADGATAKHFKAPAAGETIVGVNVSARGYHQRALNVAQDANGNYLSPNDAEVSIGDFGTYAVLAEGAPAFRGQVFVRVAADGALTNIGGTAPAAGTGLEGPVPGAEYVTTATNGVAKIRYRKV